MSPETRKTERVESIDVLRGLSCLAVVLFHVRVELWVGWVRIRSYPQEYDSFDQWAAWLSAPCPFLGYAILLFFMISGFCIHYPNVEGQSMPWNRYLARRILRIYPPYLCAVLFTAVVAWICHHGGGDKTWDMTRMFRAATLTQNYPPGSGQFLSNPALWTIPVEMEFYLFYPLVFWAWTRFGSIVVGFAALVLAGGGLALAQSDPAWSWLTFTSVLFWIFWLSGAWYANQYRRGAVGKLGAGGMVSAIVLLGMAIWTYFKYRHSPSVLASGIQYFLWGGFYFIVFRAMTGRGAPYLRKGFLGSLSRGAAWLGKISFSLYLIHFPFFKLCGFLYRNYLGEKPSNFLVTLAFIPLVIAFAWLFHKTVEIPSHALSRSLGKPSPESVADK